MNHLSQEKQDEIEELFELYDEDGSGDICIDELPTLLRALGYPVSEKMCKDLLKKYDKNKDRRLSLQEFFTLCKNEPLPPTATNEQLRAAFRAFDKNGDGVVTREELKQALTTLGEVLTDEDVEDMLNDFDVDGDGNLVYGEFVTMLEDEGLIDDVEEFFGEVEEPPEPELQQTANPKRKLKVSSYLREVQKYVKGSANDPELTIVRKMVQLKMNKFWNDDEEDCPSEKKKTEVFHCWTQTLLAQPPIQEILDDGIEPKDLNDGLLVFAFVLLNSEKDAKQRAIKVQALLMKYTEMIANCDDPEEEANLLPLTCFEPEKIINFGNLSSEEGEEDEDNGEWDDNAQGEWEWEDEEDEDEVDDKGSVDNVDAETEEPPATEESRQGDEKPVVLDDHNAQSSNKKMAELAQKCELAWTKELCGGYDDLNNPQLEVHVKEKQSAQLKLERKPKQADGKSGAAIIFFIYPSVVEGKRLVKKPNAAVAESAFMLSSNVTLSASKLRPGRYVALCCCDTPKDAACVFSSSQNSIQIRPLPFCGSSLSSSLQFRGKGAASYGSQFNPQFFLHLTEDTACNIKMDAAGGPASATRFIVKKSPFPSGVKKRSKVWIKGNENEFFVESSYMSSTCVSHNFERLAAGDYIILCFKKNAGECGPCVLTVKCADDSNATLTGQEYDGETRAKEESFLDLLKSSTTAKLENYTVKHVYNCEEAERIVNEVNKQSAANSSLFVDPQFKPQEASLNGKGKEKCKPVEWMRGDDLCDLPALFSSGIDADDIHQGFLGDCWFCSTMSALASRPAIVENIFYPKQYNKHGIYAVKLFLGTAWVSLLIDDYIPTRSQKVCFARGGDVNELWVSLLEKAMAKAVGAYNTLIGCFIMSVPMRVFSGGKCEGFYTKKKNGSEIFRDLKEAAEKDWLMTCCTNDGSELTSKKGMVLGHAYAILDAKEFSTPKNLKLIQCRNPWGHQEWNGAWSDKDSNWKQYPDVAKACQHTDADDGAFWITVEDFCGQYEFVAICATARGGKGSK